MYDKFNTGIKGKRILFIAPHPDDAAFSCAGLLNKLKDANTIQIFTLFTKSKYAPNLPEPESFTADEITDIRISEELKFSQLLGANLIIGALEDSSICKYKSDLDKTEMRMKVNQKMLCLLKDDYDFIFLPIALKNHVDHRIVLDAVYNDKDIKENENLLFYEELPYAGWFSEKKIINHMKKNFTNFKTKYNVMTRDEFKAKIRLVSCYRSQIKFFDIKFIVFHAKRLGAKFGRIYYAERIFKII